MATATREHHIDSIALSAGFTLLEMLVAISILAIGVTTATSSLAVYQRDGKLSRAASSLKLLLERAYCHALATRQELIVTVEPAMVITRTADGSERERLRFKPPIAPELRNNEPQEIHLYPSISASPTTITLRLGKSMCEVIGSLRGRVRTQCL
jgi:prepilin-type N-terminal cleavage/methylation domain-containing protein